MDTPVMSEGTRSGVHWIRLNDSAKERATARASVVFPTPGTSSSSTCPSTRMAARSCSVAARFPTTMCPTCSTRRLAASLTVVTPGSRRFERGDAAVRVATPAADRARTREGQSERHEGGELVECECHRIHDTQRERAEGPFDHEQEGRREEESERELSAVPRARGHGQRDERKEKAEPARGAPGEPPLAAAGDEARDDAVGDHDRRKKDGEDPEHPSRPL